MSGEGLRCEYPGGQINTGIPGCESPEVVESEIGTAISVEKSPDSLPVTGGDIFGSVGLALAAIFVGAGLMWRKRAARA